MKDNETIEQTEDGRWFIKTVVSQRIKAFVDADTKEAAWKALDEALAEGQLVFTDTKVDESFFTDNGDGEAWVMEWPEREHSWNAGWRSSSSPGL